MIIKHFYLEYFETDSYYSNFVFVIIKAIIVIIWEVGN